MIALENILEVELDGIWSERLCTIVELVIPDHEKKVG